MIGVGKRKRLRMTKTYCVSLQKSGNSVCTDLRVTKFSCGGSRTFSSLKWRPAVVLRCNSGMLTSTWPMNSTLRVTRMTATSSGAWLLRNILPRCLCSPKTATRIDNSGWNGKTVLSPEAWDLRLEHNRICDLWTKVNATEKSWL